MVEKLARHPSAGKNSGPYFAANPRQSGRCEAVGQGISEMRIAHGPGYRVYYLRRGEAIIILLCGGDKTTQRSDIELAQAIAFDWKG